jgi:hypothetical protein
MAIKYRRVGLGEFAGKEEVCEFNDNHAALVPGAMCAAEIPEKGAQALIDRWNRSMLNCWRYELVPHEVRSFKPRAPKGDVMLHELSLGECDGGMQDIDANNHAGIAQVVVQLDGMQHDYKPGVELANRIVALPKLIKALQDIGAAASQASMSIYDMGTTARAALEAAGIEP